MGNRAKRQEAQDKEDVKEILTKALNLDDLLYNHSNVFDFSRITIQDKVTLLNINYTRFCKFIDLSGLSANDKAYAATHLSLRAARHAITFSEDDLKKMPFDAYVSLVSIKGNEKYLRTEIYDKLLKTQKAEIFLTYPTWVVSSGYENPKLTKYNLNELSSRSPGFIESYVSNFSNLSTSDVFWKNMIKYNEKYKKIFLENTNSCTTKTDVRSVVWAYPDIIKLIDADILQSSKLTCKEWVLLISTVMNSAAWEKYHKDWEFSEEVAEMFKLDLMAEMLNGKSSLSIRFQNAMGSVFRKKEKDDQDKTDV